ncbi:ester cyclase [Phenylobacterium sp.]|uniref:ester cyclase n=1 Tax=Phenylobacterium sp. TaxID=1871053 RepID=UPI0035ADA791
MRLDRRLLLTLAAALPAAAEAQQPHFPPPVPDIPTSHVEATALAARNAATIRRHHALLNEGKIAEAVQTFAPDTLNHGVAVGRAGVLRVLTDIFTTFPDWRTDEFDLMAAGDEVVVRHLNTGTHKGVGKIPVNGGLLVGVPPTGKSFKVQSIHWYTLKDDLIVEHRASRDDIGMMQQLGLLPMSTRYDLPKV